MKRTEKGLVLGVDAGNYNTSSANVVFTSGYSKAGKESKNDDILQWKNEYYTLSPFRLPIRADKTQNEDFLILSLFAIGKELLYNKVPSGIYDVVLSVGLPPGDMSVGNLKEHLSPYYLGVHDFKINGTTYRINVQRVLVCTQGYAALHARVQTEEMKKYASTNSDHQFKTPFELLKKEPSSVLLDFGGGTTNAFELAYGKLVADISLDKGVVHLYNEINAAIKLSTGNELREYLIHAVLNDEKHRVSSESVAIIKELTSEYGKTVVYRFEEKGLRLHSSYVIGSGGGVSTVYNYFTNQVKVGKIDFIADISANAKGYEELAGMMLQTESR